LQEQREVIPLYPIFNRRKICMNIDKPLTREDVERLLQEAGSSAKLVLQGRNLEGIDLSGLDLSNASFYGADLSGANLSNANLSQIKLDFANLSEALQLHL
jgi:uncharacterized protein YjbI with pentapeptide repeats